ncbi:MAG: hypothetical protein PHS44_02065 [Candidatus Dojkabacteria bacterium]|nr:hypothetical protein [Candidatus Dojkabacteria bacterium]
MLRQSIKIFIFLFVISLVFQVLLVQVLPSVSELYYEFGQDLPVMTKAVLSLSDFIRRFWYFIIPVWFILITLLSITFGLITGNMERRGQQITDAIILIVILAGLLALFIYLPLYNLPDSIA